MRLTEETDGSMQNEIFVILMATVLLVAAGAFLFWEKKDNETKESFRNDPPIISLMDEEGFRFKKGSFVLPPEFQKKLTLQILLRIETAAVSCDCDVLEVIGHTDGMRVNGQVAGEPNFDDELIGFLTHGNLVNLVPGSNVDLGMARAGSVIRFFKEQQEMGKIPMIRQFRAYSAGQSLLIDGELAPHNLKEDRSRRRIEVRLSRSMA